MGDPIYERFRLPGISVQECLQEPSDPKKDPCKVEVREAETKLSFVLERREGKFQVASGDAASVAKAFPSYKPPAREIAEYLTVRGEFFKTLGDEQKPLEITKQFKFKHLLGEGQTVEAAIESWVNVVASFVSHGQMEPKADKAKEFQEEAVMVATYFSVDPTLRALAVKTLQGLKGNEKLGAESRKRVEWLLVVLSVQEAMLAHFKPTMDKSQAISDELRARSSGLIQFLFCNHILADKGTNDKLATPSVQGSAKVFHDVLSKVDPHYNAGKNYYAYIASTMKALKDTEVPTAYLKDFRTRINFIQSEYEKKGREEMLNILAGQDAEKSLREYLIIKYGDTPAKAMVMETFLKHMKVKTSKGKILFDFNMEKAAKEIQDGHASLPLEMKARATVALLDVLQGLFEKSGKMEIFWDKKLQETDNFYSSFPLMGANKNALEKLILWARGEAKDAKDPLAPQKIPHVAVRKWTLLAELGIGAAGTATALSLLAVDESEERWWGQGAATITAGAGFGAAAGNALSYALDIDEGDWAFDLGGSLLGGLAAGLTYGFLVPKPGNGFQPPTPTDPGRRFPVDPYGP